MISTTPTISPQVDLAALAAIAQPDGVIRDGGELVPLIRPLDADAEQMQFDSGVCAAGLKRFARRLMPGDFPAGIEMRTDANYVMVSEVTPGIRCRVGIVAIWPESN